MILNSYDWISKHRRSEIDVVWGMASIDPAIPKKQYYRCERNICKLCGDESYINLW
jgi:hypothetical protein